MKKLLSLVLCAWLALTALPFAVFAADLPADAPYVTNESVVFMDYNNGTDAATGSSANTAKKGFGTTKGSGCVGAVAKGGTIVLSGKAYVGTNYKLKVPGTVLMTSKYAGVDYMQKEPATNPGTAFKIKSGVTFTVQSNLIMDDMIVFQEAAEQTSIVVESGATLVVGKGVINMTKTGTQVKLVVEAGGRAIIGGGDFDIENNGGTVITDCTYAYNKTKQQQTVVEETTDYSGEAPGVSYISYNQGNNQNSGTSADQAKKQLLDPESNGALSLVRGGGTLVVAGRCYVGSDFTIPKLGSELTITGVYNGTSYIDREPEDNPAGGAIKIINGKTLTIATDTRLENIIFFQEGASQNSIRVAAGATLTVGEGVECMTKQTFNVKLVVDAGGTVIFESAESPFETIEGDGIVIMPETDAPAFEATRIYNNNFADVTENHWFYTYVKTAYEYTLANGTSATKFSPDGKFTVAQALTAAVNIHKAYYNKTVRAAAAGEAWYAPYVEYCVQNGIIRNGQFTDVNVNITRGDMAVVFANILPDSEYTAVRDGSNPDVTDSMPCAAAVQKLYRAGIVGGDAGTGNYRPGDAISRSEACVIFTRIAVADMRAK